MQKLNKDELAAVSNEIEKLKALIGPTKITTQDRLLW